MDESLAVTTIAHQIQLAVAPVFLLAGIGGIINVLAHRLARVVDRSRQLEAEPVAECDSGRAAYAAELVLLDRRMKVVNWAISLCTASALFVCVVVAILFVADLARIAFARPIAMLFILAMLLLIAGLCLFLYEIRLAMRALQLSRGRRDRALK
jgi:hypothetical protein